MIGLLEFHIALSEILLTACTDQLLKIRDATNLIHINQYNKDKHNLEKKNIDVDKKYQVQVV